MPTECIVRTGAVHTLMKINAAPLEWDYGHADWRYGAINMLRRAPVPRPSRGARHGEYHPLGSLRRTVARRPPSDTFDDWFNRFTRPRLAGDGALMDISIDVTQEPNAYVVKADIPGVKKEDISASVEGNLVSIGAEVKSEREEKKEETVLRQERYVGRLQRNFSLPTDVDQTKAEAVYADGVLRLTLPKRTDALFPSSKPRRDARADAPRRVCARQWPQCQSGKKESSEPTSSIFGAATAPALAKPVSAARLAAGSESKGPAYRALESNKGSSMSSGHETAYQ